VCRSNVLLLIEGIAGAGRQHSCGGVLRILPVFAMGNLASFGGVSVHYTAAPPPCGSDAGTVFHYGDGDRTLNVAPTQARLTGYGKAGPAACFLVERDELNAGACADSAAAGVIARIRVPTGSYVRVHNPLGEPRPVIDCTGDSADEVGTLLRLRWVGGKRTGVSEADAGSGKRQDSRAAAPDAVIIESAVFEVGA
jgi:hypothetical protein